MDGNVVERLENDNPQTYENVEVWAAKVMDDYTPVDAQIRNLATIDNT